MSWPLRMQPVNSASSDNLRQAHTQGGSSTVSHCSRKHKWNTRKRSSHISLWWTTCLPHAEAETETLCLQARDTTSMCAQIHPRPKTLPICFITEFGRLLSESLAQASSANRVAAEHMGPFQCENQNTSPLTMLGWCQRRRWHVQDMSCTEKEGITASMFVFA